MIAVSNTSPLILLDKTGYLWILERLFKKVVIPPAVDKEWFRPGGYIIPQWLSISQLSHDAEHIAENLYPKIDKGEAEAIALFLSMKARWLLLDDLKARRHALSMGLPVVGTVGILVTAKRKGIISEFKPILESLKRSRFYLSDEVIKKAIYLTTEE
ncbi:MAG: hypothetical protein A2889_02450 [Nitrospinae bacterium RIFCSPLOWO2_01_FULL_39_10]|nr:MAG: hypothetical protein A2889_02450 [Nitrospinae bacterium RIFCSPLOWO2_01_FULL_39_10]HBO83441.1 DUF3368 domain-containing protein [Deltaproteobacteria bacterium]